jgi:hypothetical protein
MATSNPQNNQSRSVRVEPAVAIAQQRLANGDIVGAHDAMRSALDAHRILGPANPEPKPISEALKSLDWQLSSDRVQFNWQGNATCRIDADAVAATLRTAINNAELSGDAVLLVEIDGDADPPLVDLVFDGPGSIPDTWFVGGMVPVPLEEVKLHWTRHTRGGRLDRTPNGMALKLVGQREPNPNPTEQEAMLAAVVEAERVLRLAASDKTSADQNIVQRVLDAIDDEWPACEPSDVRALLRGLIDDDHRIELQCAESLPPIALRRDRIAESLQRLRDLAQPRLDAGAGATIIVEYNAVDCAMEMECSFPRAGNDLAWQAACTALERVVDDLHQGTALTEVTEDECNISLTIPDTIGTALNEWIPGFDVLSERSVQMLRLLKSGGQAPPEDLILGGILESELERWLIARLEASPGVNVAHELEKGKNPPRLAKALGQIRKGKPKKEICAPPYAAEIIAAYRSDDRGRRALGLDVLETVEIDALLTGLTSEPLEYVTCLRLLAKITHAASS